jgi:hypothetical protein
LCENEPFNGFLVDLKKLSLSCNFENLKDGLIRNGIICGIVNTVLKDRLLREDNLTLDKCVTICRSAELAAAQLTTLNNNNQNIHRIVKKSDRSKHDFKFPDDPGNPSEKECDRCALQK